MYNKLTDPCKVACFTLWFSIHNNPRYTDLFLRLDSLVRFYKVTLSRHRILRGVQYRLWRTLSRKLIYPAVLRYLGQRYETLLTVDIHQIPTWPRNNSVVVDVDDPVFSPAEVRLLNLSQVKAIIATTERVKAVFQKLGIVRPIYVIPQGVSMEQIDPYKVRQVRTQFKGDTDIVIGYHAPTLTLSCDGPHRARQGLDDLDFLFSIIEEARQTEPQIMLWLLGEPSKSVKKYASGRSWVKLFGYIPFPNIPYYISNFNIGVYPRTYVLPPGRFSVKIIQYMACCVPIISTNVEESFIIGEAECGIICNSRENFLRALIKLVRTAGMRDELGQAGRTYAVAHFDWSILVERYIEILME